MIGYSRKMSAERALNVSYISILVQFVENLDFTATEGDKQENLILKCWPNGPHPDPLYVLAVTSVCPHGTQHSCTTTTNSFEFSSTHGDEMKR